MEDREIIDALHKKHMSERRYTALVLRAAAEELEASAPGSKALEQVQFALSLYKEALPITVEVDVSDRIPFKYDGISHSERLRRIYDNPRRR